MAESEEKTDPPADEREAIEEKDERDATATETAPPKKQPRKSPPKQDELPPFKVILHNDDVNEMAYVVQTIVGLTPLTMDVAVRRMLDAHERGQSLLLTTHKERAELYRDQFKSKSLKVTLEKA